MADGGYPLANGEHQGEDPSDDFATIKRKMVLLAMSTGSIACLITVALAHWINLSNPVDLVVLPFLGVALLALSVTLWLRPALLSWIESLGWGFLTTYLMTALGYEILAHSAPMASLGVRGYWFFFSYLLAFLIWPPKGGLAASLGVIFTLCGLSVWLGIQTHGSEVNQLASLAQLIIASLAYVFLHYSFAQLRPQYARMRTLAFSDPLTGFANRRRAEELIALELSRAERYGRTLSVILFDLDHFKQINDAHGHAVGDAVIRAITNAIHNDLRNVDHLARWGGEEFMIIAPELSHTRAALFSERLRKRISELRIGNSICPTASFGVAGLRPGDTVDSLVDRADHAMYRAKTMGRNRVELERPATAASPGQVVQAAHEATNSARRMIGD